MLRFSTFHGPNAIITQTFWENMIDVRTQKLWGGGESFLINEIFSVLEPEWKSLVTYLHAQIEEIWISSFYLFTVISKWSKLESSVQFCRRCFLWWGHLLKIFLLLFSVEEGSENANFVFSAKKRKQNKTLLLLYNSGLVGQWKILAGKEFFTLNLQNDWGDTKI